ncbi:MAG: glycerol-3-phosphate 1-O-acyltransferase PlsY [bacterium]|nr:glycerol-3-phosphate 1-O-acyltransferase PlsY [bacterium]
MSLFLTVFWSIVGYLCGSLPWGYWIGKYLYKVDIRTKGSGNIGATNVFRVLGPIPGIITFLLDVVKGALPITFVKYIHGTNTTQSALLIIGLVTIFGSKFSIFLKGKGGKAVNCSFGVILAVMPKEAIITFLLWSVVFISTGYVSMASMIAAISLPLLLWLSQKGILLIITGLVICILIMIAHRENIVRLFQGKENRFCIWKK